jgi:hypothetical protein
VISPTERARVLDAEMQLQRAWLELSLRDLSAHARQGPWSALGAIKLGKLGFSLLKHRSLWLAGISLLVNFYRRHAQKAHKDK